MSHFQTPRAPSALPFLWLLSDERNDAGLEQALTALPSGSAFVFRHYHLAKEARRKRFETLSSLARKDDHLVILSDHEDVARAWKADGIYGSPARIAEGKGLLRISTAHDGDEIQRAVAAGADAIFLSSVFPSRTHPGAPTLGIQGFNVLAQQSPVPVIALGGMTRERAELLDWPRWGAIDGLS